MCACLMQIEGFSLFCARTHSPVTPALTGPSFKPDAQLFFPLLP
jgi:hypothetical protein